MLQNNYPASEPHHECSLCHEPVSNPLCSVCLTTQIDAWLTSYPNYHQLRGHLLPRIIKFIKNSARESTICIKCNQPRVSICPYCFTEQVLEELRAMQVNKLILKEFLQFFNFDLEYKGYYKEAEEQGLV